MKNVYSIVLDEEVVNQAKARAKRLGLSLSAYIRVALTEKLEKRR